MSNSTIPSVDHTSHQAQTPPYIVKKFKEWEGMDGMGCRGEIHHPTKGKVARFFDEGCGGEMMVDPIGRTENLADMVSYSEFKAFKEWANAHPALALVFKEWGFTPAGDDHTDTLIEVLIAEFRIAKEVKKGYLCYQDDKNPMAFMGAKQGRKKVKFTPESAHWIRKEMPNCIIRNGETPSWIEGAPEVK
jgi:hypothetical protein